MAWNASCKKFTSFEEADAANYAYLASLTPEQRLEVFLQLIAPENPDQAKIEKFVRIYPLSEDR